MVIWANEGKSGNEGVERTEFGNETEGTESLSYDENMGVSRSLVSRRCQTEDIVEVSSKCDCQFD